MLLLTLCLKNILKIFQNKQIKINGDTELKIFKPDALNDLAKTKIFFNQANHELLCSLPPFQNKFLNNSFDTLRICTY